MKGCASVARCAPSAQLCLTLSLPASSLPAFFVSPLVQAHPADGSPGSPLRSGRPLTSSERSTLRARLNAQAVSAAGGNNNNASGATVPAAAATRTSHTYAAERLAAVNKSNENKTAISSHAPAPVSSPFRSASLSRSSPSKLPIRVSTGASSSSPSPSASSAAHATRPVPSIAASLIAKNKNVTSAVAALLHKFATNGNAQNNTNTTTNTSTNTNTHNKKSHTPIAEPPKSPRPMQSSSSLPSSAPASSASSPQSPLVSPSLSSVSPLSVLRHRPPVIHSPVREIERKSVIPTLTMFKPIMKGALRAREASVSPQPNNADTSSLAPTPGVTSNLLPRPFQGTTLPRTPPAGSAASPMVEPAAVQLDSAPSLSLYRSDSEDELVSGTHRSLTNHLSERKYSTAPSSSNTSPMMRPQVQAASLSPNAAFGSAPPARTRMERAQSARVESTSANTYSHGISASAPSSPLVPSTPLWSGAARLAALPETKSVDVVVIGGGLSGLTAATALADSLGKDCSIVVLEAADRVGGRTLTRHVSITQPSGQTGNVQLDLGAQWIAPNHNEIRSMATKWNCKLAQQYHTGRKIVDHQGQVHTSRSLFAHLSPWLRLKLRLLFWQLDRMAARVGAPATSPFVRAWDSTTVYGWARTHVGSSEIRDLLGVLVRLLFAVDYGEVSMFALLRHISLNGGSIERLVSIPAGHQQELFSSGAQTLSEKMALALGFGEYASVALQLAQTVVRIWIDSSPIDREDADEPIGSFSLTATQSVRVECASGTVFSAAHVILACPPTAHAKIDFLPRLPLSIDQFLHKSFMPSIVKCVLLYEHAWWRACGFSGEGIQIGDERRDESMPIFQLYDGSRVLTATGTNTEEGTNGTNEEKEEEVIQPGLIVFINSLEWVERSSNERQLGIFSHLERWFPSVPRAAIVSPIFFDDMVWSGPICCPGVGSLYSGGVASSRTAIGPIVFAGSEMADYGAGFMEGAVSAGQRAAKQVERALRGHTKQDEEEQTETESTDNANTRRVAQVDPEQGWCHSIWMRIAFAITISMTLLFTCLDPSQRAAAWHSLLSTAMRVYEDDFLPLVFASRSALSSFGLHLLHIWRVSGAQLWLDACFDAALDMHKRQA